MTWRGTRGPWKADRNMGCRRISAKVHVTSHHRQAKRTELACTSGLYDDAEDQANADGMAAVPELVEAVEMLLIEFGNEFAANPAVEAGRKALKAAKVLP